MIKKIYLAQVNYRFGDNAFLPYSIGRLWAHAKEHVQQYELKEMLWQREPIHQVTERMDSPDVLGLSTYIWNEQWNLCLAKAIKQKYPDCRIIAGGPQIPTQEIEQYMEEYGIDTVIIGEGEQAFVEALQGKRGIIHGGRIDDLNLLPSPYLTGVFDELVKDKSIKWQPLQECDRGCPYSCQFCCWGIASMNRVRQFPTTTLTKEIDWFAVHEMELVYNADANYGMLDYHEVIADKLIDCKKQTGYPQKFRAAYAKKITDRVFRIAKKLSDADLSKGATISFQSMDKDVLEYVKRINPVLKTLVDTFRCYDKADIPTYTELIVGLPGETYDSFANGIAELLEAGQHKGLNVYPCMLLKNSAMSTPEYRKRYGLKTIRVNMLILHGVPDEIPEQYDLVVETNAMPYADWHKAWEFGIIIQALHCGGITDQLSKMAYEKGIGYREFYETIIPIIPVRSWLNDVIDRALEGEPWDTVLPKYGNVQWPLEEAVTLLLTENLKTFYQDLFKLMYTRKWITVHQWHKQQMKAPNPNEWKDLETFAREAIWYGRKGKRRAIV